MAIQSSMTTGMAGSSHRIVLSVSLAPGMMNTVDVDITWDPTELDSPQNVSPSSGIGSPGKISWSNQTVDTSGTDFQVDLSCASGFNGDARVEGKATESGGSPQSHRDDVSC
jgi:hypothetical protein